MAILPNQIVLPCVIENVSDGGALLRFTEGAAPIQSFRLTVEGTEFNIVCEMRHAKGRIVGVRFARLADGAALNRYLIEMQASCAGVAMQTPQRLGPRPVRIRPTMSVRALRERFGDAMRGAPAGQAPVAGKAETHAAVAVVAVAAERAEVEAAAVPA